MLKELQERVIAAKGNFTEMDCVDGDIITMLKELIDELTKDSRKLIDELIAKDYSVKYMDRMFQIRRKFGFGELNSEDVIVYRVADDMCAYNEIKILIISVSLSEEISLIVQEGNIYYINNNDFEPIKYCTKYRSIAKCVNRLKKHLVHWIEK
jgi:hypothetical protein